MKYQEFKKAINNPYFSSLDIYMQELNVYSYQLSLWQKKDYIKKLKRGFYYFTDQRNDINSYELAFFLYQPSYISMESALSIYGLIPEIIYATTSLSSKANRKVQNDFGLFIYRHISPRLFFAYTVVETKYGKYLLAEPEKALLDYFYLNLGKINSIDDIKEIRINTEELSKLNKTKIKKYLKVFKIKKLNKMINLLFSLC